MSALKRRESGGLFPDLFDWIESPFSVLRPFMARPMRLEDFAEDGHYVVRAELPGIDPVTEAEVTVSNGTLHIRAERREENRDQAPLGVLLRRVLRHIRLPEGADEDDVTATYDKGILKVTIGFKEKEKVTGRQIPVQTAGDAKKVG